MKGKRQTLAFSYFDKLFKKDVLSGDLENSIMNATVDENGNPRVYALNRKSRRYMDKAVVQILKGTFKNESENTKANHKRKKAREKTAQKRVRNKSGNQNRQNKRKQTEEN